MVLLLSYEDYALYPESNMPGATGKYTNKASARLNSRPNRAGKILSHVGVRSK
jgi:hypothetical protein